MRNKKTVISALLITIMIFLYCRLSYGKDCKECLNILPNEKVVDTCRPFAVCCEAKVNILKNIKNPKLIFERFNTIENAKKFIELKKSIWGNLIYFSEIEWVCKYELKKGAINEI